MGKKKILVVGCGSIGRRHARFLSERKDTSVSVCDIAESNLEAACSQAQIEKRFTDYRKALEDSPEFVWVCTPENRHAEISIAALEHGAHVFCEKPLADTLESGRRIREAVVKCKKSFAVGYALRFSKAFTTIKSLLDRNVIGNVVGAQAFVGAYYTLVVAKTDSYLKQPWGLILTYTHEIDYLRWYLGSVARAVGCHARLGEMEKRPDPNVVGGVLQFETGAVVTLYMDYIQPSGRSIWLFGDKGRICYSTWAEQVAIYKDKSLPSEVIDVPAEGDSVILVEHDYFFDCVEKKLTPVVDVDDALETLRVAYLLIDSFRDSWSAVGGKA